MTQTKENTLDLLNEIIEDCNKQLELLYAQRQISIDGRDMIDHFTYLYEMLRTVSSLFRFEIRRHYQ